MIRLKDRTTSPPDGFMFTDADGWESRRAAPDTRWDFRQLVKAVKEHRIQNPHLGRTTDPAQIAEEVDQQNAQRISPIAGIQQSVVVTPQPVQPTTFAIGPSVCPPHYPCAGDVSVVISIYKPKPEVLNRCLESVIPQVADIVVVADQAGVIPEEALSHPKVRYVQMAAHDVGYGRKANYGVRYTKGRLIWFLNDDAFPAPGCCEEMVKVFRSADDIGMVGHELRYPNGTIQHGGTYRNSAGVGFPHLDTGKLEASIKETVEVESVTGASIMVRHPAFYQSGCFSTDYYLYLEDSHLCLSMRRAGWRICYTPHAKAEHLEHQSTAATPGIQERIKQSVATFQNHWGWYFDKNKNNPGLGVFQ